MKQPLKCLCLSILTFSSPIACRFLSSSVFSSCLIGHATIVLKVGNLGKKNLHFVQYFLQHFVWWCICTALTISSVDTSFNEHVIKWSANSDMTSLCLSLRGSSLRIFPNASFNKFSSLVSSIIIKATICILNKILRLLHFRGAYKGSFHTISLFKEM